MTSAAFHVNDRVSQLVRIFFVDGTLFGFQAERCKRSICPVFLLMVVLLVHCRGGLAQTTPTAPPAKASSTQESDQPVGTGSGLWKWTPVAEYHDSIVEVATSGGSGTGVLIRVEPDKPVKDGYEGLVLTAWHVIQDDIVDGQIKVTYRNKRRAKGCRVVDYDESTDIAILWVWVPEGVKPAKVSRQPVKMGDRLEMVGLGGGTNLHSCVRAFEASASTSTEMKKIYADVPLLPGDSGGPVFNDKHEVVGVISGGWFWCEKGLKTPSGMVRPTWPARASNVDPIQNMITKIDKESSIAEAIGSTAIRR